MPKDVAPGIKYWTRAEVGLPTLSSQVTPHYKSEFIVHHSGNVEARDDLANWVHAIYRQHTISNRWCDIAYNFLVMSDRKPTETVHIVEGRGWRGSGAHTIGHNSLGLGVCYLRNGAVTLGAQRGIRWIHDEATRQFGGMKSFCHRDVYSTECPGADLKAWVKTGMSVGPVNLKEASNLINKPAVAIEWTLSGNGYYIFAADGGVFAFGDASYFGSMGGQPLNAPIVDGKLHPSGNGYVLLGADGGTFVFPDHGTNYGNARQFIK